MSQEFNSDATPTLRGFRNQFIYTLYRVITHLDTTTHFLPEVKEDLSIMDDSDNITEIIQVKDYKGSLSLSSLEPRKKYSFLRRSLHELYINPKVNIRLVSFGPISNSLKDHALLEKKLIEDYSFSDGEAQLLAKNIKIEEIDSDKIESHINSFLKTTSVANDPLCAFWTLWAWTYMCAEKKKKISYKDVIEQLNRIGQFVSDRTAYHQEWFKSILPIQDKVLSERDRGVLSNEFYHGVSTQNEHIIAGLDVIRKTKLEEITLKFQSGAKAVILYGASGQGKSTIAYRFFHEYFPDYWRFQICAVENRQHALNIAAAIAGQARSVNIPLGIYLDVGPEDYGWTQVVKELAKYDNIQLLVTIREEDLQRSNISAAALGLPEQIQLQLEKNEAHEIFNILAKRNLIKEFTAFEEAWSKFGDSGPLLEFVHLVTQGVLLEDRLGQQIQRLQNEKRLDELNILSLVALASAYQARLYIRPLTEQLQIASTLRKSVLQQLENEYLIRIDDNKALVYGLHPIRSQILSRLLFDDDLNPWFAHAEKCFHLIFEYDIEIFLLSAFVHQERWIDNLLSVIYGTTLKTWSGVTGTMRALHWLGIKRYAEVNKELIHEIYQKVKHSWWFCINTDLTNAFEQIPVIGEIVKTAKWSKEPTDKQDVFIYMKKYLAVQQSIALPVDDVDWSALGITLFWAGTLNIKLPIESAARDYDASFLFQKLPIEIVADFILGASYCFHNFPEWLAQYKVLLINIFKEETSTIAIRDEEINGQKIIRIHYLVNIDSAEYQVEKANKVKRYNQSFLAAPRLSLLRKLLPVYDKYASAGYGHLKFFEGMNYPDETVRDIPINMFPPQQISRSNAVFIELVNKTFRTATLAGYAQELYTLRQAIIQLLLSLQQQLQIFFRKSLLNKGLLELLLGEQWRVCTDNLENPPLLPNSVLDEWGFIKDPTYQNTEKEQLSHDAFVKNQDIAIQVYAPFLKSFKDYCTHFGNFLFQASRIGKVYSNTPNLNRSKIKPTNDFNNDLHLSAYNLTQCLIFLNQFQSEFHKLFDRFFSDDSIDSLDKQEQELLNNIWHTWCYFSTGPNRLLTNAIAESNKDIRRLKRKARSLIEKKITNNLNLELLKITEEFTWEGHSTLTIVINCYPIKQEESIIQIRDMIKEITDSMTATNLKRYILDRFWHYFIIVPLFEGKSYNRRCYRFHWVSLDSIGLGDSNFLRNDILVCTK